MPSPRAYTPEEVIARGLAVEASGPITSRALHQALGGKGDPDTAFATWQSFAQHRDRLGLSPVSETPENLPSPASAILNQIQALGIELAKVMRDETDAKHERRAGNQVDRIDDLLLRNEALAEENAFLRSQIPALPAPRS